MKKSFTPFVTFNELALGKNGAGLPVDNVLELCLNAVGDEIIPALEKFLRNP